MEIQDLERDWNKLNSLIFLAERGVNTPVFQEVTLDGLETFGQRKKGERVSIRSFQMSSNSFSILAPFYPDTLVDDDLLGKMGDLLARGFRVIASIPIDPKDCTWRGNIVYLDKDNWILDYAEGPGTVREMERLPSTEIKTIKSLWYGKRAPTLAVTTPKGGFHGKYILNTAKSLFWGTPFLLEWSIYPYPVGLKHNPLIFWELRKV